MASFSTSNTAREPFGKNEFLRSTNPPPLTESYTFAKGAIPTVTIDGDVTKVLQPGTVIAKITSGADTDKVGVFDSTATDGREDADNIVGLAVTFLPWQLLERDVEIAVTYGCAAKQDWCIEYVAHVAEPLGDTTRDAILSLTTNSILFK